MLYFTIFLVSAALSAQYGRALSTQKKQHELENVRMRRLANDLDRINSIML